ncbi:Leucine Rich Repeat [Seminavis robusta]|uniref:Leucine Rich Repeat n=1 Tax=Seminavis robusta TaxID=568900 RepID=A0A9N8HYT5_9STRA|nr:Leucine Rich Repeat [Seminavis robusta]|eukprot:Sro3042_g342670.1 Leucine Rich Repeat (501) ;mRNA; r:2484-4200
MKDKDDTGISKSSSKSSSSSEDSDDLELAIAKSKEKMVLVGGHVQVPVGIAVDQDDNQDDDAKQFQVDQDDDLAILKMKATSEKDELIVTKMYPVAHSTARAGGILVEEEDDVDENVDMDLMEIVQLRSLEASINRDMELAVPQTRMSRSNGVAVWRESIPGAFPMDGIASSGQGQATGLEDSSDETQSTATDAPPQNDNPTAAASDILNALVEAQPVDPNATDNLGVAQPMPRPDQKDNSFWQRHGKDILIGSLVLALILGFVFGFAVGRDTSTATTTTTTTIINTNTAPTSTPSWAPTSSPTLSPTQLVLDALPDFTLAALADPDSPQSKAYQWLLDDDQDLDEYPQWRRLQRFALATLYYSTKGHLWERTDGWMSHNVSECHWIQTGGFNSTLFNNGHVYVSAFIEMVMNLFLTGQLNMGVFAAAPSDEEESFCNDQGRIAILHLANGLAGTVPNEIGFLTDISELVFWRNIDIALFPLKLEGSPISNISPLILVPS